MTNPILVWAQRLERGVYGKLGANFSRISIAVVRIRGSFACLSSALWLHGLLDEEPPLAWVCIRHKAWKPTGELSTPTRIIRTSLWPYEDDLSWIKQLPVTSLPRLAVDYSRWGRKVSATEPSDALAKILDSGRCTLDQIRACAHRYRIRWKPP